MVATGRNLPNLALRGFFDLGEDGWDGPPENYMSLNLLKLSALVQGGVIDKVSATPGSPTNGDVYIFDETHTTQANKVAVRDDGAWIHFTPGEGWLLYNRAEEYYEFFDGTVWAELETGGGGGRTDAPSDGSFYARKDGAWEPFEPGSGGGGGGGGSVVFLGEVSGTSVASLNITSAITEDFDEYLIEGIGFAPATDAASLNMRVSIDGGATWYSATEYDYANNLLGSGGYAAPLTSNSATEFPITGGAESTLPAVTSFSLKMFDPLSATKDKNIEGRSMSRSSDGNMYRLDLGFCFQNDDPINAVQFYYSSGDIAEGSVRIYGISKTAGGEGGGGGGGNLIGVAYASNATSALDTNAEIFVPDMSATFTLSSDAPVFVQFDALLSRASGQCRLIVYVDGVAYNYEATEPYYSVNQNENFMHHGHIGQTIDLEAGEHTIEIWAADALSNADTTFYERTLRIESSVVSSGGSGGGAGLYPVNALPFTSGDWLNQGGATAEFLDDGSIVLFIDSADVSDNIRGLVTALPAAPWKFRIGFMPGFAKADYQQAGVFLRDSVSGKMVVFSAYEDSATQLWFAANYDDVNDKNANVLIPNAPVPHTSPVYLHLEDDGATRTAAFGHGRFRQPYLGYGVPNNTFMVPDQIGIYISNVVNTTPKGFSCQFFSWEDLS